LDLAHTRPHRAKVVVGRTGQVLIGQELVDSSDHRVKILTKTLRSALEEFGRRSHQNLKGLLEPWPGRVEPRVDFGDAQALPLGDAGVDLIVTSPPYASNAIDYMRAHKFSLVWMGYGIDQLGEKRREYIGGESVWTRAWRNCLARQRVWWPTLQGLTRKRDACCIATTRR
jgi:hypothetical protein